MNLQSVSPYDKILIMKRLAIIGREVEASLLEMVKTFPAVAIMGPRQCGKTTLAKSIFPDLPYVSLEDPDVRRAALDDPRYFLGQWFESGKV